MVDGAKFCPKCGTPAATGDSPASHESASKTATAPVVTPTQPTPAATTPHPLYAPPQSTSQPLYTPMQPMNQPLYVPPVTPAMTPASEQDKQRYAAGFGSPWLIVINCLLTYFLFTLIALVSDDGVQVFVKFMGNGYRYLDFDDGGEIIFALLWISVILFFIGLFMVVIGLWITAIGGLARSPGAVKGSAIVTRIGSIFCAIFFYSMFALYCIGFLQVIANFDDVSYYMSDEWMANLFYSLIAMGVFLFTFALLSTQVSGMCKNTARNISLLDQGLFSSSLRSFHSEAGITATLITMITSLYSIPLVTLILSEGEASIEFGLSDVMLILAVLFGVFSSQTIAKKSNQFKLS